MKHRSPSEISTVTMRVSVDDYAKLKDLAAKSGDTMARALNTLLQGSNGAQVFELETDSQNRITELEAENVKLQSKINSLQEPKIDIWPPIKDAVIGTWKGGSGEVHETCDDLVACPGHRAQVIRALQDAGYCVMKTPGSEAGKGCRLNQVQEKSSCTLKR